MYTYIDVSAKPFIIFFLKDPVARHYINKKRESLQHNSREAQPPIADRYRGV
jgi:hypothetical protein